MRTHRTQGVDVPTWVLAAMAAIALTACSTGTGSDGATDIPESDGSTHTATATDDQPSDDQPEGDSAAPADLPVTEELAGRRLTIEAFGSAGLAFGELEEGMEVVYIEVTVENVAADPWNSNQVQFFLVEPDGELHGPELMGSDAGDTLPDVDSLEQGEISTGFVSFQVPVGSSLALEYAVDLSMGDIITIPLR